MRNSICISISPVAFDKIKNNCSTLDNLIVETKGKPPILLRLTKGTPVSDMTVAWEKLKHEIFLALEEGQERGFDSPKSEEYGKFYVYKYIYKYMEELEKKEI